MSNLGERPPAEPAAEGAAVNGERKRRKGGAREFDWSKATFGHVVLKIAYVGTNYHGLAWQEPETCPTVEAELFAALVKTCLIRDRQSCQYSRCGRTDRGVHAAGNYIALQLRLRPVKAGAQAEDYDYASMLNGVLPQDIRILAAARVPREGFDARFSCMYRAYQYYFPLNGENFARMREAAELFVGEHDFRNFCKMDVENVTNYRRKVLSVSVQPRPGDVGEFAVTGVAFLWHQVRNMVAVLLLVGQGLEEPGIVSELLDIEKHPRKPLYDPADESGLVLRDCGFQGLAFAPGPEAPAAGSLDGALAEADPIPGAPAAAPSSGAESLLRMRAQARRLAAVHECLAVAAERSAAAVSSSAATAPRPKRPYTPLFLRAACPTLEEKQQALLAKQRRKGEDPSVPAACAEPAEE